MNEWSEASDAELIAADGRSDGWATSAFAELYDRTATDVLRYFLRRTGCAQTAADLTSETFASALASRRRFRNTGAPGRAWLFTIAERQLLHFIRKEQVSSKARRRLGMERLVLDDDDLARVEQLVDVSSFASHVHTAVAELPAGQAAALRLRIDEGLPYRVVAERLGCSEGAARVRVTRALRHLADSLGDTDVRGALP